MHVERELFALCSVQSPPHRRSCAPEARVVAKQPLALPHRMPHQPDIYIRDLIYLYIQSKRTRGGAGLNIYSAAAESSARAIAPAIDAITGGATAFPISG